jgi:putative redox protein
VEILDKSIFQKARYMMVTIDMEYEGALRWKAKHGPSQTLLYTDAPVDNHGKGESFSPTDLVATALGACMGTIMGIVAERHEIDLKGMTIQVEKNMVTEPVRRIGSLPVTITLPVPVSDEDKVRLEKAALTCPVHKSLHPDIEAPVIFKWKE